MWPWHARLSSAASGTRMWLIATRRRYLRQHESVEERFRRLGWLVLWLVARHSMRLWLTALESMPALVHNRWDGRLLADDRPGVPYVVPGDAPSPDIRSCSRGSS